MLLWGVIILVMLAGLVIVWSPVYNKLASRIIISVAGVLWLFYFFASVNLTLAVERYDELFLGDMTTFTTCMKDKTNTQDCIIDYLFSVGGHIQSFSKEIGSLKK